MYWRFDLRVELEVKDQGSAILARFLPNKENGSSTEVTSKLAVQGRFEEVRWVACHDDSSSKRILQVEYMSIRSWRQDVIAYHYGWERIQ